jgi:hypothetical protein
LIHSYDGGEAAVATAGNTISSITDSAGSTTLTLDGVAGTYSSTNAGGGSSLSYAFGGNGSYSTAADTTFGYANTDNVSLIFELQFNASSLTGNQALIYNGNTSTTGIGLYLIGSSLSLVRGGVVIGGISTVATVSTGVWNSVALVAQHANTTVYLNGAAYFITTDGFNPLAGGGSEYLTMGGNGNSGEYFSGFIDNVELSTFTDTFSTSMLSHAGTSAVPEPSTYAAIFGALALGFVAWRKRRCS